MKILGQAWGEFKKKKLQKGMLQNHKMEINLFILGILVDYNYYSIF